MKKLFKRQISRSIGGNAVIMVFLFAMSILMMLPLVYAIIQSLKPMEELFIFPPRFWVVRPTLSNFKNLFLLTENLWVPFSRYLFNSFFVVIVCTVLQVIIASMAAYPLAKHQFPGKKLIFNLVVLSLLFAGEVTFLPQYILISSMNMIDTFWALILPSAAYSLGLYLMRQNLMGFPDSILEASRIDGASEATVFWKIVMPSMKPVWLTMVVFSFGSLWSRSDTNYIYSEQKKNLITLLTQISSGGIARAGVGAAISVLLMLPPIVIFIITQSNVIETMTSSGLKE